MNLLTITNEVLKIKNVSIKCVRILDIVPNSDQEAGEHVLFECGTGYTAHEEKIQTGTEQVQVGTNRVQVGTNQVLVKEAWDEQVKTGSVCTKCNAHK